MMPGGNLDLTKITLNAAVMVPKVEILRCPECNTFFPTRDDMNSHALSHHEVFKFFDVAMGLMTYRAKVVVNKTKIFQCLKCTRGFISKEKYELHKLVHWKEFFSKEDEPATKSYKCKLCQASYVELNAYKQHLLTHRPFPYVCFCGLGYRFIRKLQHHLKQVHRLSCLVPKGLSHKEMDKLVNHWQIKYYRHSKTSRQEALQTVHMNRKYEQNENVNTQRDTRVENNVVCQNCAGTKQKPNGRVPLHLQLDDRLKVFTDINKCEQCNEKFVKQPALKAYKCHFCPKAYLGYKRVENHERSNHELKKNDKLSCVLGEVSGDMDKLL